MKNGNGNRLLVQLLAAFLVVVAGLFAYLNSRVSAAELQTQEVKVQSARVDERLRSIQETVKEIRDDLRQHRETGK